MPLDNLGQFYEVRYHKPWTPIASDQYRCFLLQFEDGEKIWSNGKDTQIHWPASGSHLANHTLAVAHVVHTEAIKITNTFVYSNDKQLDQYRLNMDHAGMSLIVGVDVNNDVVVEWDLDTRAEITPEGTPTNEKAGEGWNRQSLKKEVFRGGDGPSDERSCTPPVGPKTQDSAVETSQQEKQQSNTRETKYHLKKPESPVSNYFENPAPCICGLNAAPSPYGKCTECSEIIAEQHAQQPETPAKERQGEELKEQPQTKGTFCGGDGPADEHHLTIHAVSRNQDSTVEAFHTQHQPNIPIQAGYSAEIPNSPVMNYVSFEDLGPCTRTRLNDISSPHHKCTGYSTNSQKYQEAHERTVGTQDESELTTERLTSSTAEASPSTTSGPTTQIGVGISPLLLGILTASPKFSERPQFGLDGCICEELKCKSSINALEQSSLVQGNTLGLVFGQGRPPVTDPVPAFLQQATPGTDNGSFSLVSTPEETLNLDSTLLGLVGEADNASMFSLETILEKPPNSESVQRGLLDDADDESVFSPDTLTPEPNTHDEEQQEVTNEKADIGEHGHQDLEQEKAISNSRIEHLSPAEVPTVVNITQQELPEESASHRMKAISGILGEYPTTGSDSSQEEHRTSRLEPDYSTLELTEEEVRLKEEEYYDELLKDQLEYSYYDIDDEYLPPSVRAQPPKKEPMISKLEQHLKKQPSIIFFLEELHAARQRGSEEAQVIKLLGQPKP